MTFEYRVLLSKCISEALEVYQEANIHPKALTPLPFWLLPYLLSYVPTVILQYLGRAIVNVDATATSSMYEDISNKRITEIDYLQGYIIELAEKHSIAVPHCQAIYSTIKEVEVLGNGITRYSADEIMNNFI
jgi:2-dehydropantoate 2-reductase